MDRVIPDAILEQSRCSRCFKYLTAPPIHSVQADSVCGRCFPDEGVKKGIIRTDKGPLFFQDVPLALLKYLKDPKTLYPCVNRLDGCDELMNLKYVKKHEAYCTPPKRNCPKLGCTFENVAVTQLVRHFECSHEKYIWRPWRAIGFNFRVSGKESFLFMKDDLIAFVELENEGIEGICVVKTTPLTMSGMRARVRLSVQEDYEFNVSSKCWVFEQGVEFHFEVNVGHMHSRLKNCIWCRYDILFKY